MAREEGRAATRYDWQEEDLATQRERWDISRPLQREQMMGSFEYQQAMFKYRQQDIALAKESKQLQDDQFQAWLENYNIETPLMLQQHEIDVAQKQFKLEIDRESFKLAQERFTEDKKMLEWRREQEDAELQWNYAMAVGFDIARKESEAIDKYWQHVAQNIQTSALVLGAKAGASDTNTGIGGATAGAGKGLYIGQPILKGGNNISMPPGSYGGFGSSGSMPAGLYGLPTNNAGSLNMNAAGASPWDDAIKGLREMVEAFRQGKKIVVNTDALHDAGFLMVQDFN